MITFALIAVPIALAFGGLTAIRHNVCLTETESELKDLSGMDFQIQYTNCDTLAKDESMSVYVSDSGTNSSLFHWPSKKYLLFRYDPWNSEEHLPGISISPQKEIMISIPRVSSVMVENRQWKDRNVRYEIGYIQYH
jgi:hypothetical protein